MNELTNTNYSVGIPQEGGKKRGGKFRFRFAKKGFIMKMSFELGFENDKVSDMGKWDE